MSTVLDIFTEAFEPQTAPLLPVAHLSPSSIDSFWKCAEQWRREKVDRDPRPATAETIFGGAFHRAVETNMRQKIDSHEDIPVPVMRDVAGDSFNEILEAEKGEREILWRDAKPNVVQAEVITAMVGNESHLGFHQVLAPAVQPLEVERWVTVDTPVGVPLNMRLDIEDEQGRIFDVKTSKKAKTQGDLDKSTQPTAYLWGRAAEGNPARDFTVHLAIRTKTPQQMELVTYRSAEQLAQFERLLQVTVTTITHYLETYGPEGPWPAASPLAWWCAASQCSYFPTCPWRGGTA